MARRYYKKRKVNKKKPSDYYHWKSTRIVKRIKELNETLEQCYNLFKSMKSKEEVVSKTISPFCYQVEKLHKKIDEIKKDDRYNPKGLNVVKEMFTSKLADGLKVELQPTKDEIGSIWNKAREICEDSSNLIEIKKGKVFGMSHSYECKAYYPSKAYDLIDNRVQSVREMIEVLEKAKERVVEQEEQDKKKETKNLKLKAKAAAHDGKTRKEAATVKRYLGENEKIGGICPYCGDRLGDDVHADHIWPVKHGGLSAKENMVLVCGKCNRKKSDMTLREFIEKCSINRDFIEKNLSKLNKRF